MISEWFISSKLLSKLRAGIGKVSNEILSDMGGAMFFYDENYKKILKLVKRIKSENEMLIRNNEGCQIFMAVKNTNKLNGDIAEVGSYRGGVFKNNL